MAHVLQIDPTGERFVVRDDEPIMTAVARAGYTYWRGCRRGGCGVCVATLVSGSVVNERPIAEGVLDADQIAGGAIITCRAVPRSDVIVRLRDGADLRCVSALQRQLARRELTQLFETRQQGRQQGQQKEGES